MINGEAYRFFYAWIPTNLNVLEVQHILDEIEKFTAWSEAVAISTYPVIFKKYESLIL